MDFRMLRVNTPCPFETQGPEQAEARHFHSNSHQHFNLNAEYSNDSWNLLFGTPALRRRSGQAPEEGLKSKPERMGMNENSIAETAKRSLWKVKIARKLRNKNTAGNPRIARRLMMGHPNYVSNLIPDNLDNLRLPLALIPPKPKAITSWSVPTTKNSTTYGLTTIS